jgi:16S rRNA (cytosine1402-N4)-methyltransferase
VALAIVRERDRQPIETTGRLREVVERAVPRSEHSLKSVARVFQALRIAVNDELETLSAGLPRVFERLVEGARLVVISYHSLEDRLVKNAFRDLTWTSSLPPKLAAEAGERVLPVVELLTRKAVFATDEEVENNPRARSARLRACMRTSAPNVPGRRGRDAQ